MTLDDWMARLAAAWRRLTSAGGGASVGDGASAGEGLSASEVRAAARAIVRLSSGLTRDRALAGARYFDDPALLGAYLLFYWPVSYAQAREVFAEVDRPLGRVLDLGSGPAPFALAALDAGAESALAADRHPGALAAGRELASGAALTTSVWAPPAPLPAGRFDTIVAGHLLNELDQPAAVVESWWPRLAEGGRLILVEPALRETSRALLEVRDRLVAAGAVVRAPCLFRGGCPALVRASDWCHAERPFTPPPLLDELAHAAGIQRVGVRMTYLILEAPGAAWPEPPPGRVFRIVSAPLDEKGKHRRVGCGPEGRLPLVLPKRAVTDANDSFVELERGDLVRVTNLETRGDGLRLSADSEVEVLATRRR